jgi:hypothetical protein
VFGLAWLQERKKMKYETVTEQDALLKGTPAQGGLHDINTICHLFIICYKISFPLYRLHTAIMDRPLSSAATMEVQGPDTT